MSASILLRNRPAAADDFGWFQKLAESLAGAMREFMSGPNMVSARVQTVNKARFSEWSATQPAFGILMPFELGKDADEVVFHIPGQLISEMLDLQYGGAGAVPARNSFTASEMRLVTRLAAHILPFIGSATQEVIPEPARMLSAHTDLHTFIWPRYRDSIVLADIQIERAGANPATISCFIGYARAKKIALRFSAAYPAQIPAQPEWQAKMQSAAMRVPMETRAVLTEAEFPLSRLMALRPGDILPVMLPADVPLVIAGRCFARGSIGESNGRAALQIQNMEGFQSE